MNEGRVAQQDQELAQSKHEARLMAEHYNELIEQGVEPRHARDLTIAWWCNEPA